MRRNSATLAVRGVDTAGNGPSKGRQLTNKIRRNIGRSSSPTEGAFSTSSSTRSTLSGCSLVRSFDSAVSLQARNTRAESIASNSFRRDARVESSVQSTSVHSLHSWPAAWKFGCRAGPWRGSEDTTVKSWLIPEGGLTEPLKEPEVVLSSHAKKVTESGCGLSVVAS